MKAIVLLILLMLGLGQNALARDSVAEFYDEVFDRHGHLRPQYKNIYPQLANKTEAEKKEFLANSLKAYSGDNALNDIPLILSAEEFDHVISPGVAQRVRAILAFLADDYSGERRYKEIVSEKVIEKIRMRNGEMGYLGHLDPEHIAFFYGPDLMRNSRGENMVLEDNGGAVGLAFDLRVAHQTMLSNNPEIQTQMDPRDPEVFYRTLAEQYKKRAEKFGGKAVLLVSPLRTDGEDRRVREIFESYGIETVYPYARDLKLFADDTGVYTYSKEKGMRSKEKVGFVILSADPVWYDNTHPATWERSVIEESKDLLNAKTTSPTLKEKLRELLLSEYSAYQISSLAQLLNRENPALLAPKPYPKLMEAILHNRVGTNISPGTEFVSDKEFYIYVEDFIRFYLKEEPILKNQPTWLFANEAGQLRESIFKKCFENFTNYVVKPVDGRGGDDVFVGPNTKRSLIPQIKAKVRSNPSGWLCQEYMTPSRLEGLIVDRRVIANAFLDHSYLTTFLSNVSASRGNLPNGTGKVNLSGDGRAVTVLVPKSCETRLIVRSRSSI